MLRLLVPLLLAAPALADGGHSGVATARTGPELSDAALFAFAILAVWLTRRALRNRGQQNSAAKNQALDNGAGEG